MKMKMYSYRICQKSQKDLLNPCDHNFFLLCCLFINGKPSGIGFDDTKELMPLVDSLGDVR